MGNRGGGVILNKNINKINRILSVLFHVGDVRDTLYEFNRLNVMRLILFMSETLEILYYSCEELDSESELHELKLPLKLLFMILLIT